MLLAALLAFPSSKALAQIISHGISQAKGCNNPKLVGQATFCEITATNNDGFLDTITIKEMFDIVQASPGNVRVPAAGNLPIVFVSGTTTCVVAGSFPCNLGPGASVTVRSNAYVIDGDDPSPLPDQGQIVWQDTCNIQPVGCSSQDNLGQAPATTIIAQCIANADCTGDPGVCGINQCVSNVCVIGFKPDTTVCRTSAGVCDPAENCTGSSAACPGDTFDPATKECRGSAGVCDPAENCTGSSAACPGDTFDPATKVCRTSAGVCDPAENCTGSSAACPGDTFDPDTTVCRTSAGVCDPAENCTGSTAACPGNTFDPATKECRGIAGVCDVAENCTGSAAACPGDIFLTTQCRAGDPATCNPAEFCTGTGANCPDDNPGTGCSAEACRTPGFWAQHGGEEKGCVNQTNNVIANSGPLTICGETIISYTGAANTGVGHGDSPIEALCMPNGGDYRSQVVFHLTAAALNCAANGLLPDCSNSPLFGTVFAACNTGAACAISTKDNKAAQAACVGALDCLNNGGIPGPLGSGFCGNGRCSDNGAACTGDNKSLCGNPATATCNPTNCHNLNFPNYPDSCAGSQDACKAAAKNSCDIFSPVSATCL